METLKSLRFFSISARWALAAGEGCAGFLGSGRSAADTTQLAQRKRAMRA
jgi:hypothetical protein